MTLEERVDALEQLVNRLIDLEVGNKQYTDADIAGCRQGISEVTPYTETKTAYIGDSECVFTDVPQGLMLVYVNASDGSYPAHRIERSGNVVTVSFEELEITATVTISIM